MLVRFINGSMCIYKIDGNPLKAIKYLMAATGSSNPLHCNMLEYSKIDTTDYKLNVQTNLWNKTNIKVKRILRLRIKTLWNELQ